MRITKDEAVILDRAIEFAYKTIFDKMTDKRQVRRLSVVMRVLQQKLEDYARDRRSTTRSAWRGRHELPAIIEVLERRYNITTLTK